MAAPTHLGRAIASLAAFVLVAAACADRAPPLDPAAAHPHASADHAQTVQIAPPTGIYEQDRASIVAAVELLQPGGTLQFDEGTYLIGDVTPESLNWIVIPAAGTTIQGHANGTTLRGCDPAQIVTGSCVGLRLTGGHQTVRDLDFVHFRQALSLGARPPEDPFATVGGYLVENNTFHASTYGVRSFGQWTEPATVRGNTFVNNGVGVQVWGMTVHVVDNEISAPDWGEIPDWNEPWSAITVYSWDNFQTGPCENNVVEGNRTEHFPSAVLLWAGDPQSGCRHNVIRANTALNSREVEPYPAGALWMENSTGDPSRLTNNLFEGNFIEGAQGVGVFVYWGAGNRFVGNTITGITLSQYSPAWVGQANGSGLWVSPTSSDNHVEGTVFGEITMYDVVFEGFQNTFATISASDALYDLGVGNTLLGPGNRVRNLPVPTLLGSPASRAQAAAPMRTPQGDRGRSLEP